MAARSSYCIRFGFNIKNGQMYRIKKQKKKDGTITLYSPFLFSATSIHSQENIHSFHSQYHIDKLNITRKSILVRLSQLLHLSGLIFLGISAFLFVFSNTFQQAKTVYAGSATFAEGVIQDIFQTINNVTLPALSPHIISINRTPPITFL